MICKLDTINAILYIYEIYIIVILLVFNLHLVFSLISFPLQLITYWRRIPFGELYARIDAVDVYMDVDYVYQSFLSIRGYQVGGIKRVKTTKILSSDLEMDIL